MLRTILKNRAAANLLYARNLTADLDDAASVTVPAAGMNHPRWVLGHLVMTADRMTGGALLGLPVDQPEEWNALFGPGSLPKTGAAADAYPPLTALLAAMEHEHDAIAETLLASDLSLFERATPVAASENFRTRFPTIGAALMHTLVAHEMQHLGQLSAWRRASGLPRV